MWRCRDLLQLQHDGAATNDSGPAELRSRPSPLTLHWLAPHQSHARSGAWLATSFAAQLVDICCGSCVASSVTPTLALTTETISTQPNSAIIKSTCSSSAALSYSVPLSRFRITTCCYSAGLEQFAARSASVSSGSSEIDHEPTLAMGIISKT